MSVFEKLLYKMGVIAPQDEEERAIRRARANRIIADVQRAADEAEHAAMHAKRREEYDASRSTD